MIKEFFDEVRATIINVLSELKFNGTTVLTSTHTSGRNLQIKNVANPTDDQDVVTKAYLTANGSGGVASVNDEAPDMAGNVELDLDNVTTKGATSSVHISVPDEAYGPAWAGKLQVPTKNAVYSEMEDKVDKVDGYGLVSNEDIAKIASLASGEIVSLPAGADVEERIAAAIEGTDYPVGWILTASGSQNQDLTIQHDLGLTVFDVTVFAFSDATTRQKRIGAAAYSNLYDYNGNSFKLQSLAFIPSARIDICIKFN